MSKYQYSTNTIFYQKARFFRKSGTYEPAYCIEPFIFFNDEIPYESTTNPYNLNDYQIERIKKIAYFGYGYGNHQSAEWYAITQFMIWQESDYDGDYYFTNGLNGSRINRFENEMNEINYLINQYNIKPNITNSEYTIVENQKLQLIDSNYKINDYKTNDDRISINNNVIESVELPAGEYTFTLYKDNNIHNTPQIYYQAYGTQNILKMGNIDNDSITIKVKVLKTQIELNKLDADTESILPQGEAELDGAKYDLMNSNYEIINEMEIKDNNCIIKDIPFDTYYIKEKEPGKGYTLDNETYKIEINKDNPKAVLYLKNKVIESKVTIHKTYDNNLDERNITFNIYNINNELLTNITTNEKGYAEITLPYGTYTIKQVNTTEGYNKTSDITINIEDTNDINLDIYDEKIEIEVPNTHTNIYINIITKLLYILLIIC